LKKDVQELAIQDIQRKITKLICQLTIINMQMQVEELFRRLAELKKRKLEDHEESDHISITSFENPF
jgi:hypothetical protein